MNSTVSQCYNEKLNGPRQIETSVTLHERQLSWVADRWTTRWQNATVSQESHSRPRYAGAVLRRFHTVEKCPPMMRGPSWRTSARQPDAAAHPTGWTRIWCWFSWLPRGCRQSKLKPKTNVRSCSVSVADPKILKRGRKTIYQLRPHLPQMRTTKYMPFTQIKVIDFTFIRICFNFMSVFEVAHCALCNAYILIVVMLCNFFLTTMMMSACRQQTRDTLWKRTSHSTKVFTFKIYRL